MDHKILRTAFHPPAPQNMDGYLDEITRNEVKTIKLEAMNSLDRALALIVLRPSATERAALLATLEERIEKFGHENGWMESPPPKDDATRIEEISSFVITEVFGLKIASSQDLAVSAFTAKLEEFIKENLNGKGKKSFVLLQFIYDLCQAKNPEEARNVLLKSGGSSLAKWVASHVEWQSLLKSGLRLGRVRPVVINRLTKLIALRLTSLEIRLARFARLSPWLLFMEIVFSPESIATDQYEQQCTFLAMYARIHTRRSEQFHTLITACSESDWRYRMAPGDALAITLKRLE